MKLKRNISLWLTVSILTACSAYAPDSSVVKKTAFNSVTKSLNNSENIKEEFLQEVRI